MDNIKILLVEDDNAFRQLTKDSLELTGNYDVCEARDGVEGYDAYKSFAPDIIITDVDMPKMTGHELIKKIKDNDPDTPILITSGLTTPKDLAEGFKLEIDDYIKKPFLPAELDLRITAIFRRIIRTRKINKEEGKLYTLGSYAFDLKNHCLIWENQKQNLTPREAQILQILCKNKGDIVKRKDILEQFWGTDDYFTSRSLDVFINKLRKFLENDNSVEIITIRGEGLKLVF
jgi:DNA-binding response OmpR family regulator